MFGVLNEVTTVVITARCSFQNRESISPIFEEVKEGPDKYPDSTRYVLLLLIIISCYYRDTYRGSSVDRYSSNTGLLTAGGKLSRYVRGINFDK